MRHSDEVQRDQLQVEGMRPRVLSEPASRPASAERPVTPTLKSFHISRRGKLLCHDSGGSSSTRSVVGRNQLRRRAASASLCELGEPRRRAVVSAEFSSACELGERRSKASTARGRVGGILVGV